MSPQPKAPEATDPNAPEATEKVPDTIKLPAGDNPMADRQIRAAYALEHQRGLMLKKINANRDLLRLMSETDELSDAQEEWLDTFYPFKEKDTIRSKDDVEQTRKARELARKVQVS